MQLDTSREANYLIKSNTGIYTFRWNVRADNKHYQPKLSLRTRNYLKALQSASVLALRISAISNPSVDDAKAVYYEFSGKQKRG